jgi:hypothetical protein
VVSLRGWRSLPREVGGAYQSVLMGHMGDIASTLAEHENAMLIAGGSGAGFLLPILESVVKTGRGMSVHVVVVVRHRDSVSWFVEAVERRLGEKMENCSINIEVYVTQSDRVVSKPSSGSGYSSSDESITLSDLENTDVLAKMSSEIRSKGKGNGRPDIKTLIKQSGCCSMRTCGHDARCSEFMCGSPGENFEGGWWSEGGLVAY